MKKGLLILFLICVYASGYTQYKVQANFMKDLQPALQPRKDFLFSNSKQVSKDSTTGRLTTVRTHYYFHKPSGKLRVVSVYKGNERGKTYSTTHYYFGSDSLQKIGIFFHPKVCTDCYGVYEFAKGLLVRKTENNMPEQELSRLRMHALELELEAAGLFRQP